MVSDLKMKYAVARTKHTARAAFDAASSFPGGVGVGMMVAAAIVGGEQGETLALIGGGTYALGILRRMGRDDTEALGEMTELERKALKNFKGKSGAREHDDNQPLP